MLPIYKEYIKMLKETDETIDLREGYLWFHRSIIRGYNINGELIKLARVKIDNDLNVTIKLYQDIDYTKLETWQMTIERNLKRLQELESESLKLIKSSIKKYNKHTVIMLTSGGKDSLLTSYLLLRINPNFTSVFNNTSLDCADTYKYIKQIPNIKIINPPKGFYVWRKEINFIPSHFGRGCCRIFKEEAMIENISHDDKYIFFMGMRNNESSRRTNYTDEWKNTKWGNREWIAILPIRKWTDVDVWLYTIWKGININEKYKKGYQRVGCAIACPFYEKSTWALDKYWYPFLFKRWQDILRKDFSDNHKAITLNCTLAEYMIEWTGGIVRDTPTKEVIEEFSSMNNIDYDTALKYFNHDCIICNKKIKHKEVIAMNMKCFGRNINKWYCKKHLKEQLAINDIEWNEMVNTFTEQGCVLF